ncbi:nose resistant to fluoxetine protein 6-like isoform X3 [Uloborus diversus]|nr:nose resistant to fluoxetine protein 6-like isoform X3 [Uloborus diversus]
MKQYFPNLQLTSLKCDFQDFEIGSAAFFFMSIIGVYLFVVLLSTLLSVALHLRNRISTGRNAQTCDNLKAYDEYYSNFINQNAINSYENEECEDEQSLFHQNFHADFQKTKFPSNIQKKSDSIKKFLQCFCLFSNANKILDTKTSKNEFLCIHGIRVLSMSWIILGHTYVHNMDIIANYVELWESINNLPFQIVVQGTFSVDSFFLIGGFLLSYLYLDEADKKQGKISFVKICLHRFIRITPVYMILIAFKTLLFKHISSGPFWSDDIGIGSCEKNWWWNLLYINNFLPLNSMCVSWSWYLANDMQFFVISSLVLYILWRWNKVGLGIFLTMLVCSWAITGYISHIYNVMPLFANVSEAKNYAEYYQSMLQSWNLIYSKPYCRVAPHVIGILLAVFIYKKGKEKYVMPWWMLTVGWCVAVFCSTSVVYGLYHIKSNQVLFNVYNTFARSSFCIGVSWVIYCCVSNQGGFVNRILSSKLWIPLSRLTFCAYLYHPLIMSWYFQSQKVPFYFTHSNMVVCYLAFLMMSYGIAFVISITFEAPLINIEKLITKRERR